MPVGRPAHAVGAGHDRQLLGAGVMGAGDGSAIQLFDAGRQNLDRHFIRLRRGSSKVPKTGACPNAFTIAACMVTPQIVGTYRKE